MSGAPPPPLTCEACCCHQRRELGEAGLAPEDVVHAGVALFDLHRVTGAPGRHRAAGRSERERNHKRRCRCRRRAVRANRGVPACHSAPLCTASQHSRVAWLQVGVDRAFCCDEGNALGRLRVCVRPVRARQHQAKRAACPGTRERDNLGRSNQARACVGDGARHAARVGLGVQGRAAQPPSSITAGMCSNKCAVLGPISSRCCWA